MEVKENSDEVSIRSRPLLHYQELSLGAQSRKVRHNCVHASENFLACGANNGSVYLYARSVSRTEGYNVSQYTFGKYHLVKMISPPGNDRVGVSSVSICPLQKYLVVGTTKGAVYSIHLSDYNKIGEKVGFSHDFHAGFPVTCFLWDRLGLRLFSACNGGSVCQTTLRAGMSAIFGSTDTELLLKEETGIVQLDFGKNRNSDILLVSSQSRVLLLDLTSNDGNAVQIGTKARQGSFGACLYRNTSKDVDPAPSLETKVFSARPGRRVWVADPESGTVSSTLKFSLSKNPSEFLQNPNVEIPGGPIQPRDLSINKLALFNFLPDPYFVGESKPSQISQAYPPQLVSWNIGSSVLFLLDPVTVEITEWHLDLGIIHDLKVFSDTTLLVLHGEAHKISVVQCCTARQFLDIYAGTAMRKSLELAVEFQMNDALVLETLHIQWQNLKQKQQGETQNSSSEADIDLLINEEDEQTKQLLSNLEMLLKNAKKLSERHQKYLADAAEASKSKPLQVIFKHRPQHAQGHESGENASDLFPTSVPEGEKAVVLGKGASHLHKPVEYSDAVAPPLNYSKNIYTPDGATLEAKLVEIPELGLDELVVPLSDRQSMMQDVLEELKRSESARGDDNLNLQAALKTSMTVAKAILPNANDLLMNFTGSGGGHMETAAGIFGEFPDIDEEINFDPEPLRSWYNWRKHDAQCPVLRIAMSSTEEQEKDMDTEVLLEAISMDIWDSKLKYVSNLPIQKQLNLPETKANPVVKQLQLNVRSPKSVNTLPKSPIRGHKRKDVSSPQKKGKKSPNRGSDESPSVSVSSESSSSLSPFYPSPSKQLIRRNTMSPDANRSIKRALQKQFGVTPTCEIKRKCMVGGYMAQSPELDPVLKRQVIDLKSDLTAAAALAQQTDDFNKSIWPASGITRICACLCNLFLYQGDLEEVQAAIQAWLSCFDPKAKIEDKASPNKSSVLSPQRQVITPGTSKKRGEELLDGDGLPPTRSDWNLVRTMVSLYFAIRVAGCDLKVRPCSNTTHNKKIEQSHTKPYVYELGILVEIDNIVEKDRENTWSEDEAESFIDRYGVYLNPDLAVEVCNMRRFSSALDRILNQVVSNASMIDLCDEIVNYVSENKINDAVEILKESESLCPLLHLLDLFLKKCPTEIIIDICVNKYPAIRPWNVQRSLFGSLFIDEDEEEKELLAKESIPYTTKYLAYSMLLLEKRSNEAGADKKIVNLCLKLCFHTEISAPIWKRKAKDENVNEIEARSRWICRLLRRPTVYAFDEKTLWDLFVRNDFSNGILELLLLSIQSKQLEITGETMEESLEVLIGIVLKQNDWNVLNQIFSRFGILPNGDKILGCILSYMETTSSIENQQNNQLYTYVIYSLLNAVGVAMGMKMLANFPSLFATTPLELYRTIVECQVLNKKQTEELIAMMEVTDTGVWASYTDGMSVSFAPQVMAILDLERRLSCGDTEQHITAWKTKCQQYDDEIQMYQEQSGIRFENFDLVDENTIKKHETKVLESISSQNSRTCRFYEQRNNDWGGDVQLHDSFCAVCELPVVIISEDTNCNLEVVLLPCGHAYHSCCLTDHSCSVCLEKYLETIGSKS